MRVKFLHDYGVYSKGVTYDIPREFALELVQRHHARRAGLTGDWPIEAMKKMKPSQVGRKGGL